MTTTRDPARRAAGLSPARRWTALAVLSGALAVIAMDATILNVALPHLAADLEPTAAQQLWIVDSYSLVLAGLLVSMSALADRFGRRRFLITGFAVFGGVSLAVLVADTPASVIAVRALLGVGGAMIMPTTLSMIRVIFPDPTERATALGIWAAVSAVGMAVGPIVGGLLLEHVSWRSVFLLNVPLMAVAALAGRFLLPESRSAAPPRWDTVAALGSIAGMVSFVWSIKHFAGQGFTDPVSWAALVTGTALLTWFARRCLGRPDPLLDLRLFRVGPFTAGIIAALTSMFALAALLLLITQWLQLVQGRSPLEAGLSLLPAIAAMAVASPLAPALARRLGARAVLGGGLAIAGLGFLALYLAPDPLRYSWVVTALILLGVGASSLAVGSALVMSASPPEKAGNAAALEETAYEVGSVLGVAVLGSVAAAFYSARLDLATLTGYGLDPGQAASARESLASAVQIAAQLGSDELAARAGDIFVESLTRTGLVGFVAMLVAAITVVVLVPRDFDLNRQTH